MQDIQPNLFTREDTLIGVCEGLGEDLRISPLLLRLGFTAMLFFQPVAALLGYGAAGAVVLFTRLVSPNPRRPVPQAPAIEQLEPETVTEAEAERLPLAA